MCLLDSYSGLGHNKAFQSRLVEASVLGAQIRVVRLLGSLGLPWLLSLIKNLLLLRESSLLKPLILRAPHE